MTDKGFTLDMTIPGMREAVAFAVLRSRLRLSIHFKRTDSIALHAAREWAEKLKYPKKINTTKQALEFVEEVIAQVEAANKEAASGTPASK